MWLAPDQPERHTASLSQKPNKHAYSHARHTAAHARCDGHGDEAQGRRNEMEEIRYHDTLKPAPRELDARTLEEPWAVRLNAGWKAMRSHSGEGPQRGKPVSCGFQDSPDLSSVQKEWEPFGFFFFKCG